MAITEEFITLWENINTEENKLILLPLLIDLSKAKDNLFSKISTISNFLSKILDKNIKN